MKLCKITGITDNHSKTFRVCRVVSLVICQAKAQSIEKGADLSYRIRRNYQRYGLFGYL